MAKVLCRLPNASSNINGVTFVTHRDGMISEEIDDAVASKFATIQGYEIHDPGATDKVAAAVLEAARLKREAAENQKPPAPPAGAPSSPPAGAAAPPPAPPSPPAPPAPPPASSGAASTSAPAAPATGSPPAADPTF